jgi:hypothetical protein
MTTTANVTNVAGYAMYLELRHTEVPNRVTQILISPEGMTSAHAQVPMVMYSRRLTSVQPKKQWRRSSSMLTLHTTAPADRAAARVRTARDYIEGLARANWKVYKEPIVVEATPEDLEDIRQGKTPYKLLGRVWKSRKYLGFPEGFIHPVVWAAS